MLWMDEKLLGFSCRNDGSCLIYWSGCLPAERFAPFAPKHSLTYSVAQRGDPLLRRRHQRRAIFAVPICFAYDED